MDPVTTVALVVVAIIVLAYYGMGRNVEVGSRMITRELEDAERLQKERIVRKYSNRSDKDISAANFTKATAHIKKIDELDI